MIELQIPWSIKRPREKRPYDFFPKLNSPAFVMAERCTFLASCFRCLEDIVSDFTILQGVLIACLFTPENVHDIGSAGAKHALETAHKFLSYLRLFWKRKTWFIGMLLHVKDFNFVLRSRRSLFKVY